MVTLFISPVCTPCRKAKQWLEENNLPYKERDILSEPLSEEEFRKILEMSVNGTEDIISVRSKTFRKLDIKIESLSLQELHKIIEQYPSILRRPILIDNNNLVVGYNEDAMRCFFSRSVRRLEIRAIMENIE